MKGWQIFSSASLVGLLAACGGGGGGGSDIGAGPGSTAVTASGVVTGFSSVFVNGIKYEVENGTIIAIEDEGEFAGDDSRLRVGMKVRVTAQIENGQRRAERIEFDEDLKGPVDNVMPDPANPALGEFTAAGQLVIVDAATVFDNDIGDNNGDGAIDINDLAAAPTQLVVEVSGLYTSTGLVATRIDRVNMAAGDLGRPGVPGDELEIKGIVDSVAADGSQFSVNQTVFLVGPGTFFDDGLLPNSDLLGAFVEVKADLSGPDFVAVRVEREDDLGFDSRRGEFEIEGILESVNTTVTPHQVVIDGLTIDVDDASALVDLVGARIELKGRVNANGVLVVRRSELEAEENVRSKDRVASVDTAGGNFTTRLGLVITPTGSARVEDDAGAGGDHLTPDEFLSRLQVDDYIEARGVPGASGVDWTRIERDDDSDRDCRLRGPVESIDAGAFSFVVLGVTVDTSNVADSDFQDAADQPIGRSAFFAQLAAGDIVQANSLDGDAFCASGMLTAREVEFEPDDGVVGTAPPPSGDDNPGNNDELAGPVSNVGADSFQIAGTTVMVTADTLIDASLVEAARGVELPPDDLRFGDLPETLTQLLPPGKTVSVRVDAAGNAILIEDQA